MDLSNFEIDAQLLEQFSCLGTDDRDELIKKFNHVVGTSVSSSVCQFFLDLANWNLQKAIGAYFDLNFEANIESAFSSTPMPRTQFPLYDAKFHPSPHSALRQTSPLIWCVQNSGTASWPEGSYLSVVTEPDLQSIPECDKSIVWLPIPPNCRRPVAELPPGNYAHLVVDIQLPPDEICRRILSTNIPVIGALKLCLPNGDRFGELLYCSAIPHLTTGSIFFRAGTPDTPVLPPEPHCISGELSPEQPMDEDL